MRGGIDKVHAAIEVTRPARSASTRLGLGTARRTPASGALADMAMRLFLIYVIVELAVDRGAGLDDRIRLDCCWCCSAPSCSASRWPVPRSSAISGGCGRGLTDPAGRGHRQRAGRAGHRAGGHPRAGHHGCRACCCCCRRRGPSPVRVVTALAARRMPLITVATAAASRPAAGHGDYIDGEVIDVVDVDLPSTSSLTRCRPRPTDLTTLLLGGRIHSPAMPDATAMAVRDGTVVWLGSDDVGRAQFPDAEIVDLDGGFVAPAFVDSHVHLTATGLALVGLDLRAATSREHCLPLIAEYAQAHPDGLDLGPRLGRVGLAEAAAPSTDDLDGVVGDRPAYLARVDVHSAAASTALRRTRVPDLPCRAGFRPAAPADRRRAPPGARRRARPADRRTSGPAPGSPRSTWRPPAESSPSTNARARDRRPRRLAGAARHRRTASTSSATGARRSPTARRPRTWSQTTGARGLAGRPVRRRRARARAPPGCTSPTPTRRSAAATPTSTPTPSPRICGPAPRRVSRRDST